MANRSEEILKAIETLSEKRHVISSKAMEAKHALETGRPLDHQQDSDDEDVAPAEGFPIADFNKGLRLMRSIIRDTRFDDFSALLKYPGKLMMIHFFLGLFRGLGFMAGVVLIGFMSFYLLLRFFPSVAHLLYSLLLS